METSVYRHQWSVTTRLICTLIYEKSHGQWSTGVLQVIKIFKRFIFPLTWSNSYSVRVHAVAFMNLIILNPKLIIILIRGSFSFRTSGEEYTIDNNSISSNGSFAFYILIN